jgi:hypothetical protein
VVNASARSLSTTTRQRSAGSRRQLRCTLSSARQRRMIIHAAAAPARASSSVDPIATGSGIGLSRCNTVADHGPSAATSGS